MEILSQVLAGGHHVDEQWDVVAYPVPVVVVEMDTDMPGDGVEVPWRVGRSTECRVDDNGVLEGGAGQDLRGFQILTHHLDDAFASLVGHLGARSVGRTDGRTVRKAEAEHLGERVHGERGAHRIAMTSGGS